MRNILIILVAIFGCQLVSVSLSEAAKYGLCKIKKLRGGELLFLSYTGTKGKQNYSICWREVVGKNPLRRKEFSKISYQFAYVFNSKLLQDGFDPIFNVRIKQRKSGNRVLKNRIELYRQGIRTMCGRRFGRLVDNYMNANFGEGSADGRLFNSFHKGIKRDSGVNIAKFHIWFKNSLGECTRTDSRKLRKFFQIKDIDFAPRQSIAQRIAQVFGISPRSVIAKGNDAEKYEAIRIQIHKGQFRGTELTAHFKLQRNKEYDVNIKNLSSYPEVRYLRNKKYFEIRN